jgi:hypothetical protein
MMPQQQAPPQQLPGPTEYKKQQTNILATMVPQIMNAIGGGDPYTQRALQQQQQQYEQRILQNNIKGFMRSVAMPGTGAITPELIMEQAEAWDVPPDLAMQAIAQFQAFRKSNQAEKEKFSKILPDGTVNTFQALPTDPMVQGEGVFPGELSNLPKPPALAETYNDDGTATFVEKRPGATVRTKPDKPEMIKVPDGKGGWKIVPKVAGQSGMENPKEPATKKKELDSLHSKLHKAKTNEGLQEIFANNPDLAALFGNPESKEARIRYTNYLEQRIKEVSEELGANYDGATQPTSQGQPTHEFIPGIGIQEIQ